MKWTVPVVVLLSFLVVVSTVRGDALELRSGGKISGEIEAETPDEVVIRTSVGVIRVGRSEIVRILRTSNPAPDSREPLPSDGTEQTGPRLRIKGVRPGVTPVATRGHLVLAMERGGLTTVDVSTGLKPAEFIVNPRLGPVTGLAADSGAIYITTKEGAVARIDRVNGRALWTTPLGSRVFGAPLLHRRWVFLVVPGRGLLSLESSTGVIRSTLPLDIEPDTPLVPAGAGVAIGGTDGRLLLISGDGREILSTIETSSRWFGRPPAVTLNRVAVAGKGKLLLIPLVQGTSAREAAIGLMHHPLAADPSRVYCELMGTLTALTPLTGRVMWRATETGEVGRLTIGRTEILVTTSDGHLCAVSLGGGKTLWSVGLGAQGTCPPLQVAGRVAVVTERGECQILDPSNLPPDEDPVAEVVPAEVPKGRFRSPDGYSIEMPRGWMVSKRLSKGRASVGLKPSEVGARKRFQGISEADLSELLQSGHVLIRVIPAGGESSSDLALGYLMEEQSHAREGNYRLGPPSITKSLMGGREWTQVDFSVDQEVPGGSRTLHKRSLVERLPNDRAVWIELLAPEASREECLEDLERLVASFVMEE